MKTNLVTCLLAFAVSLAGTSKLMANDSQSTPGAGAMIADAVLVRPVCFVATVVGTSFFVISLPFSALSKSVHKASHALVVTPARATFTRPLGDLDELSGD